MGSKKLNENKNSLRKTSLVYIAGTSTTLLIKFIFVPIYTFYLSEESLGWFDLLSSSAPLIAFVFSLHIEMAVLRWGLQVKSVEERIKVFSNAIFVLFTGIALFFICFMLIPIFFGEDNQLDSSITLIFLYFISIFLYVFLRQAVRSFKSSLQFVFLEITYSLLLVLGIYYFVIHNDYQLKGLLLAYIYSAFLLLIIWVSVSRLYAYFSFKAISKSYILQLVKYSSPLVINSISLWGLSYLIKFIILLFLSVSSNGIFAVAYKLGSGVQMVAKMFNMAWLDKAISSTDLKAFNNGVNLVFNKFLNLFFTVSLGVIATQKLVVNYLIGENFQEAAFYIPILAIGFFFGGMGNYIGVIYNREKMTMAISKSSIISTVVIMIFGLSLTPLIGLYGASIAFALGNVVFFFYRYADIQKFVKLTFSPFLLLSFSLLWTLHYLLSLHSEISAYIGVFLSIIFFFVYNKALIQNSFKKRTK